MAYFRCTTGGSGKGNTLVVTCADELAGATITCTNGTKTYTKTCPSTSPYEVTFYGLEAGTWTVSATVSGNTYTATVVITDYEAELGGFSWRRWVDTASQLDSTDYASLSEVLADEEAVRELCLEHACVDYMAEIATANADVETIINTDLFAKWVNNSDYALDYLYANEIIADYMDEADKYFYGEWVITDNTTTPPTWGAKGNVPVMTANTAPYGTASAYQVFDGNTSTTASGTNFSYKFTNPICPKDFYCNVNGGTLQASNDGSTWAAPTSGNYYLYLRLHFASSVSPHTIQFYGRELSVSVPVMTSSSTPYGHILVSSTYGSGEFASYKAFNSETNGWNPAASDTVGNCNLSYEFPSKMLPVLFGGSGARTSSSTSNDTWKLMVSNDGTNWIDTNKSVTFNRYSLAPILEETLLEEDYKYCKFVLTSTGGITAAWGVKFYIYGKDYSEKEFEEGATKKWLYDHGVELETLTAYHNGSTTVAEKRSDELLLSAVSDDNKVAEFYAPQIDFTPYSLMRCKVGKEAIVFNGRIGQLTVHSDYIIPVNNIGVVANANIVVDFLPYNASLDVSSLNATYYPILGQNNGGSAIKGTFTELWLE